MDTISTFVEIAFKYIAGGTVAVLFVGLLVSGCYQLFADIVAVFGTQPKPQ